MADSGKYKFKVVTKNRTYLFAAESLGKCDIPNVYEEFTYSRTFINNEMK